MGNFIWAVLFIISILVAVDHLNTRRSYPTGLQVAGTIMAWFLFNMLTIGLLL